MRTWSTDAGDVRHDPLIAAEVADWLRSQGIKETFDSDRIIGCPHEEGIDYPMGRTCPRCPFWAGIDRFTHEPIPARSHAQLVAGNLFLRKQLALCMERQAKPRRADNATRLTLVALSYLIEWRRVLTVVKPDTLTGFQAVLAVEIPVAWPTVSGCQSLIVPSSPGSRRSLKCAGSRPARPNPTSRTSC
jgi:hypothetical protein